MAIAEGRPAARLESWKEIAAYLQRDVSTVQRWEKREGMPVHRHLHGKLGSVYAFRSEVDAWWENRSVLLGEQDHASGDSDKLSVARARRRDGCRKKTSRLDAHSESFHEHRP